MTVRPGKKFGFQSAAENLQRRLWPDRLRQTVPDRCSSRWKGAVANGRTHSVSYLWAGCFVGFVDMVSECRQLSLQFSALTLGLYSAHTHPDPHWSQTRRRLFFFKIAQRLNANMSACRVRSVPLDAKQETGISRENFELSNHLDVSKWFATKSVTRPRQICLCRSNGI